MVGQGADPLRESWLARRDGAPLSRNDKPISGGATRPDKDVFIEWNEPENPNARCVVTADGWKLGLFDKDNCVLFRRTTDPLELDNLHHRDGNRETIRRLRAKIETWQRSTGDRLAL